MNLRVSEDLKLVLRCLQIFLGKPYATTCFIRAYYRGELEEIYYKGESDEPKSK